MPASDFSEHPVVQALDTAIKAVTYLRESGTKKVEVSPEVWRAIKAKPRATPPQAPKNVATPMPAVPPPSRAERAARSGMTDTPEMRLQAHEELSAVIRACANCPCASETRYIGYGCTYNPRVMVVNGACRSGEDELAMGSRLEGEAGVLLRNMFAAIHLSEDDLYITATLKCPNEGRPTAAALQSCTKHLYREIELVRPDCIVMLGDIAARAVFPRGIAASGKVGQWHLYNGKVPAIKLHHPQRIQMLAEALQKPFKLENWAALKLLQARLQDLGAKSH